MSVTIYLVVLQSHGRGSMDDKGCLIAVMEAVEALLDDGFRPRRTVYLAFGHDEEIGGSNGAAHIAKTLEARNVKAEWVLDEGAAITIGLLPGVTQPVSLIGIAEKGYMTLVLTVEQAGGLDVLKSTNVKWTMRLGCVCQWNCIRRRLNVHFSKKVK